MPGTHRRRRWLVTLAVLAVLVAAFTLRGLVPRAVTVEPVRRGRAVEAVYATGTVEPRERVVVKAPVGEHVEEALVRENDVVTRGQPLARIAAPLRQLALTEGQSRLARARAQAGPGSPLLASLEAQVRALREQEALARRELARSERLAAAQARSPQELDQARTRAAQATAQVEAAEQQLRSARLDARAARDQAATEVRALATEADDGLVTAPIAGLVLRRAVEPGEVVAINQALFEVADVSQLEIHLDVDEADIARISDGGARPATGAALTFYAMPGRPFAGTVVEILPEPDRVRRSYTVVVRLDQPAEGLRVGMTVEANLIVQRRDDALLLPVEAVDGGRAWFVEDGRVVARAVTLGIRGLTHVELRGGAAEGALAIVDTSARRPGARVRPEPRRAP